MAFLLFRCEMDLVEGEDLRYRARRRGAAVRVARPQAGVQTAVVVWAKFLEKASANPGRDISLREKSSSAIGELIPWLLKKSLQWQETAEIW
jgi:hypothetical protein